MKTLTKPHRLSIAFLLALSLISGGEARGETPHLIAYAIENPAAGPNLTPWGLGPLAVWGTRSALLYQDGQGRDWLYLQDRAGWEKHLRLPDQLTPNDRAHASYVFSGPEDFWLWSGVLGRTQLRHYRLHGEGSAIQGITRIEQFAFGDADTRPGALLALADGALVAVWHQFTLHADRHLEIGIAHRSPEGRITTLAPLRIPGREGNPVATRWALAQHPADGSIWAFLKRDSYHEITAMRLLEEAGGLKFDGLRTDFIDRRQGPHAPESEFPYLAAVADLERKLILLAYQNVRRQIFHLSDAEGTLIGGTCPVPDAGPVTAHLFDKGAQLSVAEIAGDGGLSFVALPAYTERVRPFGLAADGGILLMFEGAGCRTHATPTQQRGAELFLARHQQKWRPLQRIGRAEVVSNTLASHIFFNPERPQFVVRLDDGRLYTIEKR